MSLYRNMFNRLIDYDESSAQSDMDSGIETDSDTDAGRSSTSSEKHLYPWSRRSSRQLRELLRQRGQSASGNKSVLKSRLANSEATSSASTTSEATCSTGNANGPEQTKAPFAFAEGEAPIGPRAASRSRKPRTPKRTSSFSAHFADFINRRRVALETERQEISLYTSPLTVLSFFFLYLLHEFRMLLVWIVSQQHLLVILPLVCAILYVVYQTDGAHQPILEHAESGMIWYGYWILLGIASSVGLGTGLHTFILFLGPHIAEVTLAAYKCGNTDFDVRGDHRFVCKSPEELAVPLTIYSIFCAVQWESFFWGLGTAIGELPPYFVARAAALSGNRNEELAAIENLLLKKPDSVSYKERILLMVHEGMKRLGFFGIFLCASIPNPLFDLAGITCGHFLIPFSTFFGATFLGKAVVKSSIQTLFVILMFSADTLAAFMGWLERSNPLIHGYLADGIDSHKGALYGDAKPSEDQVENSTSLVGLIWNTIIFIMISYFLLSIVETMALAQIKRRHDQEIVELEGKIRSGDTKTLFVAVSDELLESSKRSEMRDETDRGSQPRSDEDLSQLTK